MATFEEQVEGLTSLSIDGSSAPTQNELTQFLTDGAKEIINHMPSHMLSLCSAEQSFTSGSADTLSTNKILNVFRSDGDIKQPCRAIIASNKGRYSDPDDMNYATVTDPVYYIDNNTVDVLPSGGSVTYSEVQYPAVVYSASDVGVFPDEAEYLVPLYASIKSLQNVLGNMNTVAAIDTTALGAITTELNKADNIISTAEGKINDFYTSIGDIDDTTELWDNTNKRFTVVRDALVYAANLIDGNKPDAAYDVAQNLLDVNVAFDGIQAHLADGEAILTNDPSTGDIATAITAMKNAIEAAEAAYDNFEVANTSSIFGDTYTFDANNSSLARANSALNQAENVINNDEPSASTDAYAAQVAEDFEMVSSAVRIAQSELSRAQTEIQHWVSMGDMRVKQINASLSEAQAYGSEIQARLSYANAYQQASAARGQEGQNRIAQAKVTLSVAQQELARANVAIAEINTIMGSYRLELDGVSPYLQSATIYISQAQGYVAEVNARTQREEQKYKWYQSQQTKLQADYDRGLQVLMGAKA